MKCRCNRCISVMCNCSLFFGVSFCSLKHVVCLFLSLNWLSCFFRTGLTCSQCIRRHRVCEITHIWNRGQLGPVRWCLGTVSKYLIHECRTGGEKTPRVQVYYTMTWLLLCIPRSQRPHLKMYECHCIR